MEKRILRSGVANPPKEYARGNLLPPTIIVCVLDPCRGKTSAEA